MAERAYIVTKGVVLRETETKEADKILTLLTADRGKISGPGLLLRGADRDRHGAGGPCRGTAAPSAERAVRPLRFTEAAGAGEARL